MAAGELERGGGAHAHPGAIRAGGGAEVQVPGAGRVEKGQLLGSFCLTSGYGPKYAVKVLRGRRYGPGFRAALKVCWEASDYICSQRL